MLGPKKSSLKIAAFYRFVTNKSAIITKYNIRIIKKFYLYVLLQNTIYILLQTTIRILSRLNDIYSPSV